MMRNTYTGNWFILSITCLGLGGSFAFLVGMARMPFASSFIQPDYFYHALVGHVVLAILFWLLTSAIVLWSYHFNTQGAGGMSFWLAVLGALLVAGSSLSGLGEPMLNNYVPVLVHPIFFIGLATFFIGFAMNVFHYMKHGVKGIHSDNIVTNALSAALFISVIMVAAVARSIALYGADWGKYPAQMLFERMFWTPGHIQQILNGAMLVAVWYALGKIATGSELKSWGFLKTANKALIVSAFLLLFSAFFWDPLSMKFRVWAELVYAIGLGIPLFLHMANIVRQLKWDFKTPASVSLVISMAIYFIGVVIAYAGFQNDTRVPAHYHGAVTALTLALMGFAFHMISGYGLKIAFPRAARLQPYIYGAGMLLFIAGLFVSGLFGAPRKTYGVGWTDNPVILASLGMMGAGTLLAVIGGAIFVIYASVTLIRNRAL